MVFKGSQHGTVGVNHFEASTARQNQLQILGTLARIGALVPHTERNVAAIRGQLVALEHTRRLEEKLVATLKVAVRDRRRLTVHVHWQQLL